jgi:hypothetical protein
MTHLGERRTVFFGQAAGRRKARRGRNILLSEGEGTFFLENGTFVQGVPSERKAKGAGLTV